MKRVKSFLKQVTNTKEKKVVIGNFFSLSFLQIANYVLPLVTLPYLVRVIGVEKFGLIAFAQAFIQFFIIFVDYGFNLSATRSISVHHNDRNKVDEIFNSVMAIKLGFVFISFLILLGLITFVPKFKEDFLIYIFSFGMVIGNALFPTWFFQGMEKMKYITFLNVIAKIIFTLSIFIFVRERQHYLYVPLINSSGFLVAGFLGLLIIKKHFNVKFNLPNYKNVKHQLKEGRHIFISNIAISLYTTSNVFILGLFTNNVIVGYYSAGEKIIRTLIRLFEPFFQAIYPYISKVADESRDRAIQNLKKISALTFVLSLCGFLIFSTFLRKIVLIFLGRNFFESIMIMRILSPLLLVIPMAYVFANLGLLPLRLDRFFSKIYMFGAIVNLFLLFFLLGILKLGAIGAAFSNLIIECMLTFIMFLLLKKKTTGFISLQKHGQTKY